MLNVFTTLGTSTIVGNLITVSGSFVLLLVLIRVFAWKNITGIFEKRADKIASELDKAEDAKIEAQELVKQRQTQLDDVKNVADKIILEAKNNAESMKSRIIENAENQASGLKAKAKLDIEKQKAEALVEMRHEVSAISIDLAQEILMEELTPDAHSQLIERYLNNLGE